RISPRQPIAFAESRQELLLHPRHRVVGQLRGKQAPGGYLVAEEVDDSLDRPVIDNGLILGQIQNHHQSIADRVYAVVDAVLGIDFVDVVVVPRHRGRLIGETDQDGRSLGDRGDSHGIDDLFDIRAKRIYTALVRWFGIGDAPSQT